MCDGEGCKHCDDGQFKLTECARRYIRDLSSAINIAASVDKGFLPCAGGLLDQSSWFLDLWTSLHNEQNKLDAERLEKINHG